MPRPARSGPGPARADATVLERPARRPGRWPRGGRGEVRYRAMAIVGTVLTLVVTYAAALALVARVRRRPVVLTAILAFSVLVVFEALLLDVLSLFRAFAPPGVAAGHAAAVGAALAAMGGRAAAASLASAGRRLLRAVRSLGAAGLLLAPLAVLVAVSAVRYPPNTWDSMTYHLARVAHWIQYRSIAPYPTHIGRQVLYQSGAEYVVAVLQVLSGSDRLASLQQLCAWALIVLAAPALARLAGAPRRLSLAVALLVAALPAAVLQASSTQTDLVAAVATLGVVAAAVPFLHASPRWTWWDAALLGVAVAAAALVKATALVATAPVLAAALLRSFTSGWTRAAVAVAVVVAVAAVPLAPEVARRTGDDLAGVRREHAERFLYPALGDAGDRALNLARGVLRHVPAPRAVVEAAGIPADPWCPPGATRWTTCGRLALRPHEDWAGNPLHLAVFAVALAVALARRRRLPACAAFAVGAAASAWVLFHVVFRDNPWIVRLELPTWVLAGAASAAVWGTRRGVAKPRTRYVVAAFVAPAVAALALGLGIAVDDETRPPLGGDGSALLAGYYVNRPLAKHGQDVALREARARGCRRIGVVLGDDGYDYPLTWRAMREGREVRHVFSGADPWPCLVFGDGGALPASFAAAGWVPAASEGVWVRGEAGARADPR